MECYWPHFTNRETEAQGDDVTCPKPTASRGLQRPYAFQYTRIPPDCPQHLLCFPIPIPTSLQVPLGIPASVKMTTPGSHFPVGPISCRHQDEPSTGLDAWADTPPVLLDTWVWAPPEKTNSFTFSKDLR
ncbi:hypothetical protein VULLAG_LOCUS7399 [Vulpes lagopus]